MSSECGGVNRDTGSSQPMKISAKFESAIERALRDHPMLEVEPGRRVRVRLTRSIQQDNGMGFKVLKNRTHLCFYREMEMISCLSSNR